MATKDEKEVLANEALILRNAARVIRSQAGAVSEPFRTRLVERAHGVTRVAERLERMSSS